jgi:hypothetical protein
MEAEIAGVFTILGAVIGALVAYPLSLRISRNNEWLKACNEFRAAFSPEIAFMRLPSTTSGIAIQRELETAFVRHCIAIETFRFFVPAKKQRDFDQAWRDYYEVGGSVRFFYYVDGDECRDGKLLFHSRIDALFQFTDRCTGLRIP